MSNYYIVLWGVEGGGWAYYLGTEQSARRILFTDGTVWGPPGNQTLSQYADSEKEQPSGPNGAAALMGPFDEDSLTAAEGMLELSIVRDASPSGGASFGGQSGGGRKRRKSSKHSKLKRKKSSKRRKTKKRKSKRKKSRRRR